MRVYLADLAYLNDWDTNQPVPLNAGYIAAYLQARRPGDEIKVFKERRHLMRRAAVQAWASDSLAQPLMPEKSLKRDCR